MIAEAVAISLASLATITVATLRFADRMVLYDRQREDRLEAAAREDAQDPRLKAIAKKRRVLERDRAEWRKVKSMSATQAVAAAQARLSASLEAEGRAGGHTPPGRGTSKGGVQAGGSARGSDASGGAAARRGDAGDAVPGGAAGQVAALGEELAVLRVKIADQGTQVQQLRAAAAAAGAGGQEAGHGRRHVAHGGAAAGGEAGHTASGEQGQKTTRLGGGEHGQGRAAAGPPAGPPRKEGAVAAQLDTRPPDAPPPPPASAAPAAAPASLPPVAVPPASSESPHPGTPSHAAGGVGTPSSGRRGWSTSRGDTPGGSGGGEGPGEGPVDPTPAEALAALKRRTPTSSKAE
jgi:hypothetical protein